MLLPQPARSEPRVPVIPSDKSGWSAQLRLDFAFRDGATRLIHNIHKGPLAVQKSLYPEGPEVCHALILHPPSGMVGADTLDIDLKLNTGSHALITMPGAAKWYRSAGAAATQRLNLGVAAGATLEWLPQETIMYNGAIANMHAVIDLADGGNFVGWDIICLGRTAAGEKFESGTVHQTTEISIAGELLWSERCRLYGGSPLLDSPVALAGAPVSGVMIAAGKNIPAEILARCRAIAVESPARTGISAMPKILVARYTGHMGEQAKYYFTALWRELRPLLAGRAAILPRIWST